jgi:antirestriction protein ArdC
MPAVKTRPKTGRSVRDAAAETTSAILAQLEAGTVPWQRPWTAGPVRVPTSLSSGKPYRGINVFLLDFEAMAKGYSSPYWGTYKQVGERGGQVRRGEKSTQIIFWKILSRTGQLNGETVTQVIPLLRLFHVFNLDQCDWSADARLPAVPEPNPVAAIEHARALVDGYLAHGPSLAHGGDSAYYRPASDAVQMPPLDAFQSAEHYYSTLYHELTHSTGHDSRLKRDGIAQGTFGRFGDPVYSFEELVAEMGAAMCCLLAGINQAATLPSSASYLAHWVSTLRGDASLIIKAASAAQKAVDLLAGTTFTETD